MQGNLNFHGGLEGSLRAGVLEATTVELASHLSDFFFFFLATWVLESKISPGEVEDKDK